MSKNLTRKGLALGAIATLVGSLFTSLPASAAISEQLTLLPSTGTAYKTIEGEAFKLTQGLLPTSSQPVSNTTLLKYSITTTATLETGWPKVNGKSLGATAGTDTLVRTAVAPSVQPANTSVFSEGTTPVPGANQTLDLKIAAGTLAAGATASVAVTAFFDLDADNVYDEGLDAAAPTRTITWVALEDMVGTVTLTQPYVGDTTATASVVLDGFNQEQIALHTVAVYFTDASDSVLKGLTASTSAAASDIVVAAFAAGKYSATTPALTALVRPATVSASGSVKATAFVRQAAGAAATTFASNATAPTVIAASAVRLGSAFFAAEIRTYDTVTTSADFTANSLAASSTGNTAVSVRVNSEVKVAALLSKGATAQPNASISAKITTPVTLSSTKTLTVNGTTYSANADLPTALALTSNADGNVFVTFNTVGFAIGNAVAIEFKGQGLTKTVTATSVALAYTVVETKNVLASNERSMNLGSSAKLAYQVVDQFEEPIVSGFRLRLTATNATGTPLTVSPAFFEGVLTGGKTEFTVGNAAVGIYTVAVALQQYNTSTLLWDPFSGTATVPVTINVNVIKVQKDVVGISLATGEDSEAVADAVETANDTRVSRAASKVYTAGERATIGVLVSEDITDIGRKGAEVTVSAAGLLFGNAAGNYEVADSFSAYADASGVISVDAISNIEGTFTITVTSGAASATTKVTFVSALPTASITWKDVPRSASTQRTLEVTAVTKDKYGNFVGDTLALTNSGSGYWISTSIVTDEVKGEGVGRYGVWLNEFGPANIVATFNTISAQTTIDWGLTEVTLESAGKRVLVEVSFAKGKTVTVFVNGKRIYSKVQSSDEIQTLAFTQRRAGTYAVTVRVTGGLAITERVVVR